MKKKLIVCSSLLTAGFIFLLFMGVLSLAVGVSGAQSESNGLSTGFSQEVEDYRSTVLRAAEKKKIDGYVNHLLSIMQEETGGTGTDVMNAGSFGSNTKYEKRRGGILNPNYSIECGVNEFCDLLSLVGVTSESDTDKLLIVYQAYHTDRGYIEYALNNGGYTPENAQQYLTAHSYPDYVDNSFAENVAFWYKTATLGSGKFIYPLTSRVISSPFGNRTGTYSGFHGGCDFPAPIGTPVYASADGKVTLAGWNGTYGNCVIIQHSAVYTTLYAHNSSLAVKLGDEVKQGDVIAYVGSTGQSTGPHCHFEIRINGERVDPIPILSASETNE